MTFQIVYPKNLEQIRRKTRAIVVDLRENQTFLKEHYPGAVNYPYEEAEDFQKYLSRNRLYIFYCEHGGSSMQLARQLGLLGYRTATVIGGYHAIKKVVEKNDQNK